MENQHRIIKGYRDLSQGEIDLMNEIKAHEALTLALVEKVRGHLTVQEQDSVSGTTEDRLRIVDAEPRRWLAMARTDFQTGFMNLVRSVAQPQPPSL